MTFKVHIESNERNFTVLAGESIIDAAVRQGVMLPYGCRNGMCGACKGRVVVGQVDYGTHSVYALSEQEKVAGLALFCQAKPLTDIVIEPRSVDITGQETVVKRLPCRVEKKERLAPDVMRLYLKLPNTERLQYVAGQYINIILRDGRRRSFSIASAPHRDVAVLAHPSAHRTWASCPAQVPPEAGCLARPAAATQAGSIELHIAKMVDGEFTGHVFNGMKEKDILRIEGPLGDFTLRKDSTRPIIFLAAGTGFAPIKAIIEAALAQGIQRPMYLYWGATTRAALYLDSMVREWVSKVENLVYVPVLSRPAPEDHWGGKQGYVQDTVVADFPDLRSFEIYASGVPAMINAARQMCLTHGLPLEYFYFDAFEFSGDIKSVD